MIRMLGDGTFTLLSGGADLGTGLDTVAVKVAAECLCTDMSNIAIISGDTDATPFDTGAYASSGTFFSGNAALQAAKLMKEKILDVAAGMLKEDKQDLQILYPGIVKGKKVPSPIKKLKLFQKKAPVGANSSPQPVLPPMIQRFHMVPISVRWPSIPAPGQLRYRDIMPCRIAARP